MATRNERVVLTLEDNFTTGMAKAAVATSLLDKALDKLDGSQIDAGDSASKAAKKTKEYTLEMAVAEEKANRFKKALRDQAKAQLDAADGLGQVEDKLRTSGAEIDRFSGRVRLLLDSAVTLGPALIPLGAAAVPGLAALAIGFGAAAGAAGVAVLAFNGMGDALEAIETARIEPTTENLQAMRVALDDLGPAGAEFATFIGSLGPQLDALQNVARAGLFPGLQEGIESLLTDLPQVERVVGNIASALGGLAADTGAGLAGPGFSAFFDYLESDAGPILTNFGQSIGNLAEAFANMVVAFGPLTSSFGNGLEDLTQKFADWSAGLADNQGFQSFLSYVQESGPMALDAIGAITKALAGIVEAAAPFGQAVLPAITALANVLATIASSPVGPVLFTAAAGLVAFNRAAAISKGAMAALGSSADLASSKVANLGKSLGIAAVAVTAFSSGTDILDSFGRSIDTVGASAADVEQLTSLFEDSNVGKYAQSLGIDLNRLAEDLVTSGREGDYYAEVLDKIGGHADGVGGKINALTDFINPFIGDTEQATLASSDFGRILGNNEQLLGSGAAAASSAVSANQAYSATIFGAAEAAAASQAEIEGMTNAMRDQVNAALGAFDAVTGYRQALKDARAQAEKTDAGIRGNSDAALANRGALSSLAAAWNAQSDAAKNTPGAYAAARRAFIETATAMGVPIGKARELFNQLNEIPPKKVTTVTAETGQATNALGIIRSMLAGLQSKTVTLTTVRRQVNETSASAMGPRPARRTHEQRPHPRRTPRGASRMTLVAVATFDNRAEFITDTLNYTNNSSRFGHSTKSMPIPHIDAAVLTIGDGEMGNSAKVAALAASDTSPDFDDLLRDAELWLRVLWSDLEPKDHRNDGCIVFVGYSPTAGRFRCVTYSSTDDFRPTEQTGLFIHPSPWSMRPSKVEHDVMAEHLRRGDPERAERILGAWSEKPTPAVPTTKKQWVDLACTARKERALTPFASTAVAGRVFHTRLRRASVDTSVIHTFDDTGEEFAQLVEGSQHPIAQAGPCWCGSGERYVDCHIAQWYADGHTCDCGSGEPFADCCSIGAVAREHR